MIIEKITRIIELDAKVNGIKSQIRDTDTQIEDSKKAISENAEIEQNLLNDRDKATREVKVAEDEVGSIQARIKELQAKLTAAKLSHKRALENLGSFTEEVLFKPNNDINILEDTIEALVLKRSQLVEDLKETQDDIEKLNAELKAEGYEINRHEPAPSVTYL